MRCAAPGAAWAAFGRSIRPFITAHEPPGPDLTPYHSEQISAFTARNVEVDGALETAAGSRLVAFIVQSAPEEAITACYVDRVAGASRYPQECSADLAPADLAVIEAIDPNRPKRCNWESTSSRLCDFEARGQHRRRSFHETDRIDQCDPECRMQLYSKMAAQSEPGPSLFNARSARSRHSRRTTNSNTGAYAAVTQTRPRHHQPARKPSRGRCGRCRSHDDRD